MKIKYLATLLFACFAFTAHAADEPSIYEIISNEDEHTFFELLMLGYDIDDTDNDGNTPLIIASSLGKAKFVQFLLDNGASVDNKNFNGETALHRAAQAGNNEIIDILFANGANLNEPDFSGKTPLMLAVASERRFAVERLVTLGTYTDWRDRDGDTALSLAERKRFKQIADYLRSKGINR